jgi:hypothetical protein
MNRVCAYLKPYRCQTYLCQDHKGRLFCQCRCMYIRMYLCMYIFRKPSKSHGTHVLPVTSCDDMWRHASRVTTCVACDDMCRVWRHLTICLMWRHVSYVTTYVACDDMYCIWWHVKHVTSCNDVWRHITTCDVMCRMWQQRFPFVSPAFQSAASSFLPLSCFQLDTQHEKIFVVKSARRVFESSEKIHAWLMLAPRHFPSSFCLDSF